MKSHKLILFLSFLIGMNLYAKSSPHIYTEVSIQETSENIERQSISINYESNRKNVFWPYEPDEKSQIDYIVNLNYLNMTTNTGGYTGERGLVGARFNLEDKSLKAMAGVHLLNNPSDVNSTNFTAQLLYKHKFSKKFLYRVQYDYDLFYRNLTLPHLITEDLKAHTLSSYFFYSFTKNFRSSMRLRSEFISDENRRDLVSLASAYRISQIPWFWAGISADYNRTNRTVRGYWTPRNQTSFGPFIEFSTLIYNDITLATDIFVNRYYAGSYNLWGDGHYAVLKLMKGDRNKTNYGIQLINMRSQEEGSTWTSSIGKVFLNYFF